MSMVINSNITSLNAQRNLSMTQGDQSKAMQRLSSGKRINTAADDAAGLAISNRMTSQVRGLDQAIRNSNDGVSLIQTAEGALDTTSNILQRMRELAVQSANGTYSSGNRKTLNAEVQQLKSEIDRIADTTKFNGLKILDGTLGKVDIQAGADAYETIGLNIGATNSQYLGGRSADVTGTAGSDIDFATNGFTVAGNVTINNQVITGGANNDFQSVTNLKGLMDLFAEKVSGVKVEAYAEIQAESTGSGVLNSGESMKITTTNADGTTTDYMITDTSNLKDMADKINDVTKGKVSATIAKDSKGLDRLSIGADNVASIAVDLTTATAASTGFSADDVTANFALTMTDTDLSNGKEIKVEYGTAADAAVLGIDARDASSVTGAAAGTAAAIAAGDIVINGVDIGAVASGNDALVNAINSKTNETGVVASHATGVFTLKSSGGNLINLKQTSAGAGVTGLQNTNSSDFNGGSVASIDISTVEGAQSSLATITKALDQISETRGDLGAISNRLGHTVKNLANVSENVSAARSRIEDADFAAESAALSRAQVLQQAGTAMLAQANAIPKQVLSLLQ